MGVFDAGGRKENNGLSAERAYDMAQALYEQKKFKECVCYYEAAAKLGHAKALNCLGCRYRDGEGVEVSYSKAVEYFKAAIELGNTKAAGNLGVLFYFGSEGFCQDKKQAFFYLEKAAAAGIDFAMLPLADLYYQGEVCKENRKLAAYWACSAIKNECCEAYYMLGVFYDEGYYFPECPAYAKYCFERAAEYGYNVEGKLADEKYNGVASIEPILPSFDDSDEDFFTQNCPYEQFLDALCILRKNEDMPNVDSETARQLLTASAAQGYADAQFFLGTKLLDDGDSTNILPGFEYNTPLALYYLNLAAKQGHCGALDALDVLYESGSVGIDADAAKAEEYRALRNKLYKAEIDCAEEATSENQAILN